MLRQSSLALLFAAAAAVAVPQALAPSEVKSNPTVIELFTSQSCYSCPPAEAFLGELVEERSDILALEFHVDYWDELVHRGSKWKDVFSSPDSTQRQRVYNVSIRGRASVYTPQMIIGGAAEAVGSNRGNVLAALSQASGTGPAGRGVDRGRWRRLPRDHRRCGGRRRHRLVRRVFARAHNRGAAW